jgi:hypothetical protein
MKRRYRLILPGVILATFATVPPAAAQVRVSEAATFLQAVRNRDGAKVQEIVSNPSSAAINAKDPSTGEGALHMLVQRRDLGWLAFYSAAAPERIFRTIRE